MIHTGPSLCPSCATLLPQDGSCCDSCDWTKPEPSSCVCGELVLPAARDAHQASCPELSALSYMKLARSHFRRPGSWEAEIVRKVARGLWCMDSDAVKAIHAMTTKALGGDDA